MTEASVEHSGLVAIEIKETVHVKLTEIDIFNWLTDCTNPNTLLYLGNYASKRGKAIREGNSEEIEVE